MALSLIRHGHGMMELSCAAECSGIIHAYIGIAVAARPQSGRGPSNAAVSWPTTACTGVEVSLTKSL